jgi:hypothetical protein
MNVPWMADTLEFLIADSEFLIQADVIQQPAGRR